MSIQYVSPGSTTQLEVAPIYTSIFRGDLTTESESCWLIHNESGTQASSCSGLSSKGENGWNYTEDGMLTVPSNGASLNDDYAAQWFTNRRFDEATGKYLYDVTNTGFVVVCMTAEIDVTLLQSAEEGTPPAHRSQFSATVTTKGGNDPKTYNWTFPAGLVNDGDHPVNGQGTTSVSFWVDTGSQPPTANTTSSSSGSSESSESSTTEYTGWGTVSVDVTSGDSPPCTAHAEASVAGSTGGIGIGSGSSYGGSGSGGSLGSLNPGGSSGGSGNPVDPNGSSSGTTDPQPSGQPSDSNTSSGSNGSSESQNSNQSSGSNSSPLPSLSSSPSNNPSSSNSLSPSDSSSGYSSDSSILSSETLSSTTSSLQNSSSGINSSNQSSDTSSDFSSSLSSQNSSFTASPDPDECREVVGNAAVLVVGCAAECLWIPPRPTLSNTEEKNEYLVQMPSGKPEGRTLTLQIRIEGDDYTDYQKGISAPFIIHLLPCTRYFMRWLID